MDAPMAYVANCKSMKL